MAQDKFNRNYILRVERRDGTILEVRRPFTIEFDIHRNQFSSANVAQLRVYNLSANNRSQIRHDQFDYGVRKAVSFSAGYGTNLSFAFTGNITQAWSVREGVNFISQIECYDGGFAFNNGFTKSAFPANTPVKSAITSVAKDLPGIKIGAIGNFEGESSRGNAYSGSPMDALSALTGGSAFIDLEHINCLKENECIESSIPLINAQAGLLNTPVREQSFITFEMLFEPSLKINQLIRLESLTADHFNGVHKVVSLVHRGIISDAVCGNATTTVGLLPGILNSGETLLGGFTQVPSGGN